MTGLIVGGVLGFLALNIVVYFLRGFYTVEQQTVAVIQRWGKFYRIALPGLGWRWPIMDKIFWRPSLRVKETRLKLETKTHDNVFANVHLSIQYRVLEDKVHDAAYKLTNVVEQMSSYVYNTVRAFVATIKLDDLFERQDDIEKAAEAALGKVMGEYGYKLVAVQVTDIDPDAAVKKEMNRINAAQRACVAAEREGEAEKIKMIKVAEGNAESKRLAGLGIANERREIAKGIHDAREQVKEGSEGMDDRGVMKILGLVQYLDTLAAFAKAEGTKTILVPHSPGGLADFERQLEMAVLVGNEMGSNGAE
ncbi:SPFH domain-containing protein [Candidatus Peregrinibacteria bacterium]|nr:SPFH domain-containing protein [Candidatus Peregrinibacteria bacterium]